MRYCIIQPLASHIKVNLIFPLPFFLLLVVVVVMIAAAGYIINDYFDVKSDMVNRPKKVIIGQLIKPKAAYNAYFILNFMALGTALFLSIKIGSFVLFTIFPIVIGMLWFYTTTYKKQLLIGNILVSGITAGVPILVALFEILPIYHRYHVAFAESELTQSVVKAWLNGVFAWIGMFAFFAFIVNFIRELIKDLEDIPGDQEIGRNTVPIVFGIRTTKIIITSVIVAVIAVLSHVFYHYLTPSCAGKFDLVTFLYFLLLIFIPLIVVITLVNKSKTKKHYAFASLILKCLMLIGLLYAIIVKLNIDNCPLDV
jgi:4-hydroxybenzoate polyprenyltransferase